MVRSYYLSGTGPKLTTAARPDVIDVRLEARGRLVGDAFLISELRRCKGAINAVLNPRRTRQQLHEGSVKRRIADLLLEGENQGINLKDLFKRFDCKCFKCGKSLKFSERGSWEVDHVLPSKFLYPLTAENAALLRASCNNNKHSRWPIDYYTNGELIALSRITGADLSLLANSAAVVNANIDVDACVARFLKVRERSNLKKRLMELRSLLKDYGLTEKLSSSQCSTCSVKISATRNHLTAIFTNSCAMSHFRLLPRCKTRKPSGFSRSRACRNIGS